MGKRQFKRQPRPGKHKQDLGEQIEDPASYGVRTKPRAEKKRARAPDEDDDAGALLSAKDSGRILREARLQQEELDAEEAAADADAAGPGHLPVRGRGVEEDCMCKRG